MKTTTKHSSIFLVALGLGCHLCASSSPGAGASSPKPPNVIFILADDLGYGDPSCYGQTNFSTPNIDRLAKEGMKFTDFYAGGTVCAPSRSSLITGLHTGHTPIRGNSERIPEGQAPLPAGVTTLPEVLHAAGYVCGGFGKWGLGFIGTEGDPLAQGFDRFFGYNCQRWAHRYYPAYLWDDRRQFFLPGNDMSHTTTYAPAVIQQRAEAFIRDNKDRPFFVYLAAPLPHAELLAPDDAMLAQFKGKFPEKPFAGWAGPWGGTADYGPDAAPGGYCPQPMPRATYAAMVTHLDQQVGGILRLVDELGLADNTIIMFSSDNGPHSEGGNDPHFFNSSGPLRGTKRDLYEGGIRVPMLVRWSGRITAGSTSSLPAAFWDVLPTLAEVAGAKVPKGMDGISLAPTLLGKGEQAKHDYLYWEFGEVNAGQAVRAGDWKAINFFAQPGKPARIELYNLATDLSETSDVAAAHPDVVAAMQGRMREAHDANPLFLLPVDEGFVPAAANKSKATANVIDD